MCSLKEMGVHAVPIEAEMKIARQHKLPSAAESQAVIVLGKKKEALRKYAHGQTRAQLRDELMECDVDASDMLKDECIEEYVQLKCDFPDVHVEKREDCREITKKGNSCFL